MMITKKILKDKWDQCCANSDEPFEIFSEYLKSIGCTRSLTVETHWGSGGVGDCIQELTELLNSGSNYEIFDDPTLEGSDTFGFLLFDKNIPKVGTAIAIRKENRVLLGLRKGSHAAGQWAFPGGHLEYMEDPEDCCKREVLEETGLEVANLKFWAYTNDKFPEDNKHYITLVFVADWQKGEPKVMEPDKCDGWRWYDWNDLPQPLMLPIRQLQHLSPFEE